VIMYKWDVEKALQLIEREQISHFVGVPAQGWDLVNFERFADYVTSSLRSIGGGGAPAPASQVEKTAKAFPKGAPGIGYGMTETNAYGPQNSGADYVSHPTSAGRWVPPFQVRICDEAGSVLGPDVRGEICFKGPNLIRGYWNKPEATAGAFVDGWLRTGDVGRIDADGFVYVEDRVKDMILRGGENVYCAEVESAIYEHPAVHEAAVFGLPHERLGEEVACAVLPIEGTSLSVDVLRTFLATKIAAFKVPAHMFIVDEPLPRNAAGKFLKRDLRDRYTA
jgi:long-chain acyl-CoA synthetase